MENETVWLTQAQMAELFQKDRTVISRHIRNVFNEGELEEQSTCAKFAHMGHDGFAWRCRPANCCKKCNC